MESKILELITSVRPNGIELDAYPYIMELIISVVKLELTKK